MNKNFSFLTVHDPNVNDFTVECSFSVNRWFLSNKRPNLIQGFNLRSTLQYWSSDKCCYLMFVRSYQVYDVPCLSIQYSAQYSAHFVAYLPGGVGGGGVDTTKPLQGCRKGKRDRRYATNMGTVLYKILVNIHLKILTLAGSYFWKCSLYTCRVEWF